MPSLLCSRESTAFSAAFATNFATGDRGGPPPRTELELGAVRLTVLRCPAPPAPSAAPVSSASRTPFASLAPIAPATPGARRPARSGGPQTWRLVLVSDGPLTLGPGPGATRLDPGHLVLWDPGEPFDPVAADRARPPRALVLHLPGTALSVPHQALRGLMARPISSEAGPAALLARFLEGLAGPGATVETRQAAWLGRAAVDLAVAFLSSVTDPRDDAAPRPRRMALLGEIRSYVERHLGDPDLSPKAIAAAHHISVRYLHHLFRQDGQTVGGFVRERRLERCRADLTDPCLAGHSMAVIRVRWGFHDAAVFNRAFKKEYGITPGEYRRREGVPAGAR
ncbi:helix-turn-helix domain-containing protein [Streptomyces sparsogenes]|uniref:helix-turn-helix domain-containing protein n=1 Tax=Streptomyces sparsogenes TaxID=67365 RepID=UPI0038504AF9